MEIERKYLVKKEKWAILDKPPSDKITQGYLSTDINKTIRVRIKNSSAWMTVKGKTHNYSREEIEFEIPLAKAEELLNKFTGNIIEKKRYVLKYKGKKWEVDEFLGVNEGLILAEIELKTEDEEFELPEWIDKEVSDDYRYYNSFLSENPINIIDRINKYL